MPPFSKVNSGSVKNKAFVASRSKKIDDAFKKLLAVGEKIETLTLQINAEIKPQENKTELTFLQRLKPKVIKLAQLYQEELVCIEIIKHNEAEISSGSELSPPLPVPLFILEEKTWKKLGLSNPWAELKLPSKTLLELAIENEIEEHSVLSTIHQEEIQFKQQMASWQNELSLLGISTQYKTNTKLKQHEFENLLNSFAIENQPTDIAAELNLYSEAAQLQKVPLAIATDINLKQDIENLSTEESETAKSVEELLQEMEYLTQQLDEIPEAHTVENAADMTELVDAQPKAVSEKKRIANIDLTCIDQEIAKFLTFPAKSNASQPPLENPIDKQQQLLKLDSEIADYVEKMDIVIQGSTACDARLLEYLRVRAKSIARLLIEKDFLHHDNVNDPEKLEHYISENLAEKMAALLTELLEPLKETLIANIHKENQEIITYNKKHNKNRPLKVFNDYEWGAFSKRLLDGIVVK